MPGTWSKLVTVITGQTITASLWNNEFDNVITNATPAGTDDDSANLSAMQSTTDPYPSAAESLATDLSGELRRLRYLIAQLSGRTQWYQDPLFAQTCCGRLTLTTATPVTSSDVTAATTVYFTPFKGSIVTLYDGTSWKPYTFTELSVAVPGTTSTNYDVYIYNNSGTLTLEAVAWTDNTTRATALVVQNGVYVKTGSTGNRYLGTFRTTGVSGQTEDSVAKRFLWNYQHRVLRDMIAVETTDTWAYTTDTLRQANGATANKLDFVIGVSEDMVYGEVRAIAANTIAGTRLAVGVGLSSDAVDSSVIRHESVSAVADSRFMLSAIFHQYVGAGYRFLVWLERSAAAGTSTWYGDNGGTTLKSGIFGHILA